jgi:hypothetical protein
MSGFKTKTPAEELIESLLKDVGEDSSDGLELKTDDEDQQSSSDEDAISLEEESSLDENDIADFLGMGKGKSLNALAGSANSNDFDNKTKTEYEKTRMTVGSNELSGLNLNPDELPNIPSAMAAMQASDYGATAVKSDDQTSALAPTDSMVTKPMANNSDYKGADVIRLESTNRIPSESYGDSEKTVAVAGYQVRREDNYDDRVKVSVGQQGRSTGYATWGASGSAESNLAHADNLRIAQEKILDLESENEKLRLQNEELMAASEIIKERSDLLSSQVSDYKNDRDGLEESFKNETVLLKNHLTKKDSELQKAVLKADELESRLKFDMKKIRVRERELENRLELIRAEKNAIVKNKDEQILDLRRKMDVLQMEVDSYRQKCVELNKSIELNQESFKRTTRALRLAMANLELQEENKVPLKKAE